MFKSGSFCDKIKQVPEGVLSLNNYGVLLNNSCISEKQFNFIVIDGIIRNSHVAFVPPSLHPYHGPPESEVSESQPGFQRLCRCHQCPVLQCITHTNRLDTKVRHCLQPSDCTEVLHSVWQFWQIPKLPLMWINKSLHKWRVLHCISYWSWETKWSWEKFHCSVIQNGEKKDVTWLRDFLWIPWASS